MMAAPQTRLYAFDLKEALREVEPELSDVLVPNCVYRCGCPENGSCTYYQKLLAVVPDIASVDIQKRYDAYNCYIYGGTRFDR
jgi:hypothetical protein